MSCPLLTKREPRSVVPLSCLSVSPSSIQEFKFMGQCRSPSLSPSRQASASASGSAQAEPSLFQQYLQEGNPFEMHIEHKDEETEDVLASNGVGATRDVGRCVVPV